MAEAGRHDEGTRPSVEAFAKAVLSRSGIEHLGAHLEATHDIRIAELKELDIGVFRVDRPSGPSLVARVFPSLRPVQQAVADAELLRRLEAAGFPAERCAVADPVSVLDGQPVLLTTFVPGERARRGPRTLAMLGDLLARLAAHPVRAPALTRPAGSWHHLSPEGGGRRRDIEALSAYLGEREAGADTFERRALSAIREAVERLDDGAGLPSAFIHPDLTPPNVLMTGGGPVVIDWTGAGMAPRIFPLGYLLWVAGAGDPALVDPVVAGYRRDVGLRADELERLPDAIRATSLVIEAWSVVVGRSRAADVAAQLADRQAVAQVIAERARGQFARS
ncbi:MAG TPA: phosphotransferase [Candidatus Acidoferrales bacterium]|nr:phosphotransferase [Candidatus Acidoferrales bacterium]